MNVINDAISVAVADAERRHAAALANARADDEKGHAAALANAERRHAAALENFRTTADSKREGTGKLSIDKSYSYESTITSFNSKISRLKYTFAFLLKLLRFLFWKKLND